jgi:hypothetical protein
MSIHCTPELYNSHYKIKIFPDDGILHWNYILHGIYPLSARPNRFFLTLVRPKARVNVFTNNNFIILYVRGTRKEKAHGVMVSSVILLFLIMYAYSSLLLYLLFSLPHSVAKCLVNLSSQTFRCFFSPFASYPFFAAVCAVYYSSDLI